MPRALYSGRLGTTFGASDEEKERGRALVVAVVVVRGVFEEGSDGRTMLTGVSLLRRRVAGLPER